MKGSVAIFEVSVGRYCIFIIIIIIFFLCWRTVHIQVRQWYSVVKVIVAHTVPGRRSGRSPGARSWRGQMYVIWKLILSMFYPLLDRRFERWKYWTNMSETKKNALLLFRQHDRLVSVSAWSWSTRTRMGLGRTCLCLWTLSALWTRRSSCTPFSQFLSSSQPSSRTYIFSFESCGR